MSLKICRISDLQKTVGFQQHLDSNLNSDTSLNTILVICGDQCFKFTVTWGKILLKWSVQPRVKSF